MTPFLCSRMTLFRDGSMCSELTLFLCLEMTRLPSYRNPRIYGEHPETQREEIARYVTLRFPRFGGPF